MKHKRRLLSVGLLGITSLACAPLHAAPTVDHDFFEQKIRPVLAEKCFECHSTDSKNLKANLLLDSREGLLKGGDTGPSIAPDAPEKSLLLAALHYADPETAMPPKKAGGKLPDAVIADFEAWVKAGAPWPESATPAKKTSKKFDLALRKEEHWCWKAPTASPLPAVKSKTWPRTTADHFLLAKMEASGLAPAPDADKGALLRRVTLDLTGLPPSASDLRSFLEDKAPNALDKVVDRLLASPQFGERWTRHWLDLVRYAESRGHEFDPIIPNAWQYRDYVVRALNADVPYNRFVQEHIAGDLLPARINATTGANESILGTGFWFLTEEVHSPVDMRQDEVDRIDNRVDVMSKTFLGLAVGCARCHDHKFDAISQKDYYALAGFLISSSQRLARFETLEQERAAAAALPALHKELAPHLLKLTAQALRPALENPSAEIRSEIRKAVFPALPPQPEASAPRVLADYTGTGGTMFLQDGFAFGNGPVRAGEAVIGSSAETPLTAVTTHGAARRDEAWKNIKSVGDKDPGSLKDFQRSGQSLRTPECNLESGQLWYLVRGAGRAYAVVHSHLMIQGPLHGKVLTTWKDSDRWDWVPHNLSNHKGMRAHIELMPEGTGDFEVAMVVESLEKPALPEAYRPPAPPSSKEAFDALIRSTLSAMEEGSLAADPVQARLADWMVRNLERLCPKGSPERAALSLAAGPAMERYQKVAASFKAESQVATAMFDGSGVDEFLLKRGSPRTPAQAVPRRFLEAIAGPEPLAPKSGSGRRELAEMVASTTNPLTARVIVNRVWHHLFGKGIVPTVDNFGVLGQAPSHQELLDTLAVRFTTEQQWSLKALIRELVLSRAYAMSSSPISPEAEEKDPQNLLLHRMNIKRLEGEAIRDSLLAISGRLDSTMGGPSVPVHVTSFMEGRGRPASGPLDGNGRRSLYIAIKRNFLSPMMLAFDTPIPFNTMGRRNVSNVPAQSLVMMNDPFVVQQAALWAKNLPITQSAPERLETMYMSAFSRAPQPEEASAALAFLSEQAASLGVSKNDPAVWADLAHVLFNAQEFIHTH